MLMVINNSSPLKVMVKNITLIIMAIIAAFWLSACGLSPSSTGQAQAQNQTKTPIDSPQQSATNIDPLTHQDRGYPTDDVVQACRAQGGEVTKTGRTQSYRCVLPYTDAGKICQDSTDCQGACETSGEFISSGLSNQSGQCASDNTPFGCRQVIEKGVAQSAICVD